MIDFINMTPNQRFEAATKDNICDQIVPSDIRQLLGEINKLEEMNKFFNGIFNERRLTIAAAAMNGMLQNPNLEMDAGELCRTSWDYANLMMETNEED